MVAALGAGQCVSWGVLYYAFAVLVRPIERELAVPTWLVTGAFSLALLMSAVAAPTVGAWADRDRGPRVMRAGGFAAAGLLVAWTLLPGVAATYVVWAGLGLCMAATLYEPAFVIVGRAHDDPARRLRAIAIVTLLGGLASTLFLPLTARLVGAIGWRGGVLVLAAVLAASTAVTQWLVFGRLTPPPHLQVQAPADRDAAPVFAQAPGRSFLYLEATFGLVSLAGAAFIANLVPALAERGVAPGTAAMLGGLVGVMQLPGRALMLHGALAGPPVRLLVVSLALQAAGFGAVSLGRSVAVTATGIATFALGAGLSTLVRPHLVQTLYSNQSGGSLNGRIARVQQLARAAGPLSMAWVAGTTGYSVVLALLAAAFTGVAITTAASMPGGRGRRGRVRLA